MLEGCSAGDRSPSQLISLGTPSCVMSEAFNLAQNLIFRTRSPKRSIRVFFKRTCHEGCAGISCCELLEQWKTDWRPCSSDWHIAPKQHTSIATVRTTFWIAVKLRHSICILCFSSPSSSHNIYLNIVVASEICPYSMLLLHLLQVQQVRFSGTCKTALKFTSCLLIAYYVMHTLIFVMSKSL